MPDESASAEHWEREWERHVITECLDRARREHAPETFRAFELAVCGKRPTEEVAKELGVTVKSVYNAKHRVLKRVRELRMQFEETG